MGGFICRSQVCSGPYFSNDVSGDDVEKQPIQLSDQHLGNPILSLPVTGFLFKAF